METLSRSEITREALRYMGLKCKGVPGPDTKEIMVSCPLHGHDKNPSMGINLEKGVYNCFACGASGSIESLFYKVTGSSLRKTLNINDDPFSRFAIPLTKPKEEDDYKLKTVYINYNARDFSEIKTSPDCIEYLKKRGIGESSVRASNCKYVEETRINGTLFKKRLIIPVKENGRIISFEGRDITGQQTPKVLYPKNCSVNTLFDIDLLDKNQPLFAVEGLMDLFVLRACRSFKNSTSIFGANLTKRQIKLMSEFPSVVYIPDSDDAGERTISILKSSGLSNVSILRLPSKLFGVPIKDVGDIPKAINPAGRRASVQDLVNLKWLKRIEKL